MSFGKMNVTISIVEEIHDTDGDGFDVSRDNIIAEVRAYREGADKEVGIRSHKAAHDAPQKSELTA